MTGCNIKHLTDGGFQYGTKALGLFLTRMLPDPRSPAMQEPDCVDIEVFVGVNIAKGDHYACAVTSAGTEVLARSVRNDEASRSGA